MYLCIRQQMRHLNREEYEILRELCHTAKNLYNEGLYQIRQHFFATGEYLPYVKNYHLLKGSENYRLLNSNMAQQILKEADGAFQSFFALRKKKQEQGDTGRVRMPGYLSKDGFFTLVIGFVRLGEGTFTLPYSGAYGKGHKSMTVRIPPVLKGKKIREIRIKPQAGGKFFEIQYTYEIEEEQNFPDRKKALAIDLGLENLASCVTEEGKTFLIDGRKLKSINQWYNKENARLQKIKDRQGIRKTTKAQDVLARKRNNRVRDYMSKAGRRIIDYCLEEKIGTVVVGYQKDFQKKSRLGRKNNQNFVNILYGKFVRKLEYLCKRYGIRLVIQEESYTSKASFFDGDEMPVYGEETGELRFSGRRKTRGMYETGKGYCLNADINGVLNILRKSKVVCLSALYNRGGVDTPQRILPAGSVRI